MEINDLITRQKKLTNLAKFFYTYKNEWIDESIKDTKVTYQYAQIDCFQAIKGMKFQQFELDYLKDRNPLGKVRCGLPKNAVGVAMGISVAASYITGNEVEIRLSSTQDNIAALISYLLKKANISGIKVIKDDAKKFIFDSISGGYNALHIFAHDRNITPWNEQIKKAIQKGHLNYFGAELTGKDFFFGLPDANIKKMARDFTYANTISSGQVCMSPEAAFIHKSQTSKFISQLKKFSSNIVVGDPYNKKTQIGPLMSKSVYNNALLHITDAIDKGAILHKIPSIRKTKNIDKWINNLYIPEHILEIHDWDSSALHEETFCPAFLVVPYKHFDQVIEHMNTLKYGLTSSIYGKKFSKIVQDKLNGTIGIIFENKPFYKGFDIHKRCWGGFGLSGFEMRLNQTGEFKVDRGPKYLLSSLSKI